MDIVAVRHSWPEPASDFEIKRPNGYEYYVFVHLYEPVDMVIDGEVTRTAPSACVFYDLSYPQLWKPRGCGITHDWMHIDGDMPSLMARYGLEFNKIYYPSSPRAVTELVREVEAEYFAEKPFYEEICEMKLRELMMKLSRCRGADSAETTLDAGTERRLRELREEIFSDLSARIDPDEMAKRLSVCKSKFYLLYRELFGISPTKDIINARMEKAKTLLLSGDHSVSQVATMVGYKNEFHFIRCFKAAVGVTPGRFGKSENREGDET